MTQKHTPIPWKSDSIGVIHAFERGVVAEVAYYRLDEYEESHPIFIDEVNANADLIVKAVNRDHLFDELVKALKSITGAFGHPDSAESQAFWEGIAADRESVDTIEAEYQTRPIIIKERLIEEARAILAKVCT